MHDVPLTLVEAQAEAAGLPLLTVPLPWPCPNTAYEAATGDALAEAWERLGVTHVAFGDLFLEDIRRYREQLMADGRADTAVPAVGPADRSAGASDGRRRPPRPCGLCGHRSA